MRGYQKTTPFFTDYTPETEENEDPHTKITKKTPETWIPKILVIIYQRFDSEENISEYYLRMNEHGENVNLLLTLRLNAIPPLLFSGQLFFFFWG